MSLCDALKKGNFLNLLYSQSYESFLLLFPQIFTLMSHWPFALLLFRTTSCYRVTPVLNNTGCLHSVPVCACVSERRDIEYVYESLSFSFIIT